MCFDAGLEGTGGRAPRPPKRRLGGGGYPVSDHDPNDKGKVNGVVFDLLDHLDEWYGQADEIGHVLVVVRVTDSDGGRCTDVVTSPDTPKEEALDMLARAHAVHNRPVAHTAAGNPGRRGWWRRVFGGRARTRHGRR